MRRSVGAAAAREARETAALVAQLGAPVASCRRIAVTSIRGGAGKSTIAALIAGTLCRHRRDRVVALDADPGAGSLALRLGARGDRSLRDLAAARPRTWDEAAVHLTRTDENLWVLPAAPPGRVGDDLDRATYATGAGVLGRYFAASVIDCGAGLGTDLHHAVLSDAHAQIFVVPGTGDGAVSAHAALDWFARSGHGPLLSRTVIALVARTPYGDADLGKAREVLGRGGAPVIEVPYDRHLAAGIAITPDHVSASVLDAVTEITAEAFGRSLWGDAS
nr:MinD/ParA family protein [Actinomadura rayongensis]